ncbi:sulfatase [Altererythrobacter sp. B11]|uniref:arylsulfatase n=1 Tax=Altererythrobacter sp. B11 TaxID=2060312 RepID=UPI000DC701DF|nr:arylsulfatase [Altererythrobacter sp. B11]BBC74280.1 sulfatase [Altererythrobacter sp. B11]
MGRTRLTLLVAAGGFALAGCAHTGNLAQSSGGAALPPDIVLIVLDDVGFSDIGSFGSEIRTPNIDALAAAGLRYNRFDTKAVCSPTRAALLTGRNPQTVRMADLPARQVDPQDLTRDRGELPQNASTIAQVLQRAGYATRGFGKWHLAPENEDGSPGNNASWPLQRGFDEFYGFFLGWTDQYHPKLIEGNARLPEPDRDGYHFSVDITDRAIAALDQASDKPRFVYLAYGAAHAPIQVPAKYIHAYDGVYAKGWDKLREERLARQKALGIIPQQAQLSPRNPGDRAWDDLTDTERAVFARFMQVYAGFLTHADEQIGRLVDHLKRTGRFDNTLIVVVSDNGAASEAGQNGSFQHLYRPETMTAAEMLERIDELGTDKTQSEYQRPWAMLGSTPYKRYKLWPYLGGVRTSLILSWPREVDDPGAIRHQYIDAVDIAPTLADAAGTSFPDSVNGREEIPVAGHSILSTVRSASAPAPRNVQYFELRGNRAITMGDWRALAVHLNGTDFAEDRWQLYDLASDPTESRDLAAAMPEKLEELKALWWREARRHSTPALAEAPEAFRSRESFDESEANANRSYGASPR